MLQEGNEPMRSVLKLTAIIFLSFVVPTILLGLGFYFELNEIGILIAQMLVILIYIFIFTKAFQYQKKYEEETIRLMGETRDINKLRELRDQRHSYKSKAKISGKIVSIKATDEELENLKKYASTPEDMDHYYAGLIDKADKNDREALRKRRDNFDARFGKKRRVYPDVKENLRTSIKWMLYFFLVALIYNFIPRFITNETSLAAYILIGMLILAIVMINTIIWIVRTVASYWASDYI